MILDRIKLERAVTFNQYIARLQSVTKIIETHYIFIKKVHKKTLGLVKVT